MADPELSQVDQYRVSRLLGRGGRAEVYLARDTQLGRLVALKILSASVADGADLDEARATATLSHPNVVTVYAVGQHQGRPYLALEHIEGETLRARLRRGLGRDEALRIGHGVAQGLAHAHERGVIHRDLKPENVMLASDGRARIVDFGIAALAHAAPRGQRAGTPPYMAPERGSVADATPAMDVWSFGVVLHEMLAGQRPADGISSAIDGPAARLVESCLQPSPAERPDAARLVEELGKILAHPPWTGRCPFPGLRPYAAEDAWCFTGRDEDCAALLERLRRDPVVVLAGPSGAGKTSLVHAGIVPRLREQGPWQLIDLDDGQPLPQLARRLVQLLPAEAPTSRDQAEADLGGLLEQSPAMLVLLLERVARQGEARVLLVVDGLDRCRERDREPLLAALAALAEEPDSPARALVVLRDDRMVQIAASAPGRALFGASRVTLLASPPAPALRRSLAAALARAEHGADEDLLDALTQDAADRPGSLALLQLAARSLWQRRDPSARTLRLSDYRAIGGVAGALVSHADEVLAGLPDEDRELARRLLVRLVGGDGAPAPASEPDLLDGLGQGGPALLDTLAEQRLVVVRRGSEGAEVALSHAALALFPGTIRSWLRLDHLRLGMTDELEQAARLWERRGRPDDVLWSASALSEARRCLGEGPTSPAAETFIKASEERARRRARGRLFGWIAGAVALAAFVFAFWPGQGRQRVPVPAAERSSRRWVGAKLAAARHALARGSPLRARAALRAVLEAGDSLPARALWLQLPRLEPRWTRDLEGPVLLDLAAEAGVVFGIRGRGLVTLDPGGADRLVVAGAAPTALALSPDGRHVAWAEADTVSLRPRSGAAAARRVPLSAAARTLCFTSDGGPLVVGRVDGVVELRSVPALAPLGRAQAHAGAVTAVAVAPGANRLATGGADRTVRLWTLPRLGAEEATLVGHVAPLSALTFADRGRLLVSADTGGVIRVWDVATRRTARLLEGAAGPVRELGAGPNLRLRAVTDRAVHGFDLSSGEETDREILPAGGRATLGPGRSTLVARGARLRLMATAEPVSRGHRGPIHALSIDRAGARAATAGQDGTVRLWGPAGPETSPPLRGHAGAVRAVALAPDGAALASGGEDGVVRLWDVDRGRETWVSGHEGRVTALRFAPDRSWLASGHADGSLRLRWLGARRQDTVLTGHRAAVLAIEVAPDGAWLASAGADRTIRIWSVEGEAPRVLVGHRAPIAGLAVAPDGRRLASADERGEVRIWRVPDGAPDPAPLRVGRRARIAFLADGQLAVASIGRPVRLCRRAPGGLRCQAVLPRPSPPVNAIAAGAHLLATVDDDGTLLRHDTTALRPIPSASTPTLAIGDLRLVDDVARVERPGGPLVLARGVTAIARERAPPHRAVVASRDALRFFDGGGHLVSRWAAPVGVTALLPGSDGGVVLGLADGSVERAVPPAGTRTRIREADGVGVTTLAAGPPGTLFVGQRSGGVELWLAGSTRPAWRGKLHGPINELRLKGAELRARSATGDRLALPLVPLVASYCELMRNVWASSPVVLGGDRPLDRPPPTSHRCAARAP